MGKKFEELHRNGFWGGGGGSKQNMWEGAEKEKVHKKEVRNGKPGGGSFSKRGC